MNSKTPITRIWHGITKIADAESYLNYLRETGVKDYKASSGCLSVEIWRRLEWDKAHFWTVTKWDSLDSIKKFAGEDPEKARYYPKDAEYLLELEPNVIHCETFEF